MSEFDHRSEGEIAQAVRRWRDAEDKGRKDRDIKQLKAELAALTAQLAEANEKLRWRTWPEEAPTKDGMYLAKGDRGIESEYYDHSKGEGWQVFHYDYGSTIPWLPIPASEVKG
jgi:hypothetical protein